LFPLVVSKAAPLGFEPEASLPTARHLTRMLRVLPNVPELPPTPLQNPVPAKSVAVGEFYWGYRSGVVATKVPDWGEFVLAELTQPFDHADVTYFFPLMAQTEQQLGFKPRFGAFDAALDAFYVYDYFHSDLHPALALASVINSTATAPPTNRSTSSALPPKGSIRRPSLLVLSGLICAMVKLSPIRTP
jgi:hypothetical protein